jgi:hypothetical protein
MVSVFHPDVPLVVYCNSCWWSDKWDAADYFFEYDPEKPFMLQIRELMRRVPVMNLYGLYTTLVNSDYTNMVGYLKNCYLTTYADHNENILYSSMVLYSKDSVDNLILYESELCYECVNCNKCYAARHSLDCDACANIDYCRNCVGCSDCFGCVNLKNKKYYIFNEPFSKEEYENKIAELRKDADGRKLWYKFPQKYIHGRHNVDVSGDYIEGSKNVHDSYMTFKMEDSRYCTYTTGGKDCYDFTNYAETSELLYETLQAGDHISRVRWSFFVVTGVRDVDYSMFIIGGNNLFGCVGLRKKEYCILNKQYTPEEYSKLRTKIIEGMKTRGEWGEFFSPEFSPFAYNETTAYEHFPLTRDEVLAKGYEWREREKSNYQIGGDVVACEHGGSCEHDCPGAFRLVPAEKEFYTKMRLPPPTQCPNCRHAARLVWRNPIKLYDRVCANCGEKIRTSYAPDRLEVVYCEICYQQKMV